MIFVNNVFAQLSFITIISFPKMLKTLFFFLWLINSPFPADAQCVSGNCNNGYGVALFPEKGKARYNGQFLNQKPHGFGRAEYGDGSYYEGNWLNGKWHGQGSMTLASGTLLTGTWQDSRFMGSDPAFAADQKPMPNPTLKKPVAEPVETSKTNETPTTPSEQPPTQAAPVQLIAPKQRVTTAVTTPQYGKPKQQVWVMSVGVASYKNPRIALKYPQSDALEMQGLWRGPEGGSLDYDHIMVLTNDRATRRNILDSMRVLFSRASEDDLVVFYFSGHGLKGAFLPHDYDDNDVKIEYTELNGLLKSCPAKHKLVIGDACFVGSLWASKAVETSVLQSPDEVQSDAFFRELNRTAPGTAFLLSSSADEESFEISSYGRSIFTHYILEGLKGAANANDDDVITVKELFDYAAENVRILANRVKKAQTPLLRGNYDPNMPVAMKRQSDR